MTDTRKETDKEVLRRIMSEPTFKNVAEAARRENARREKEIIDALRSAKRQVPNAR